MTVRLLSSYAIIYNLQNTYLMLSRISIKIGVKNDISFFEIPTLISCIWGHPEENGTGFFKEYVLFWIFLEWILFE